MTLTIAAVNNGISYIASDFCISESNGNVCHLTNTLKCFERSGVLIGCAGSVRIINILYNSLDLASIERASKDSHDEFLYSLANHIMTLLEHFSCYVIEDGLMLMPQSSEILVVKDGIIAVINNDFSYMEVKNNYYAIGNTNVASGLLCNIKNINTESGVSKLIANCFLETSKICPSVSKEHIIFKREQ